MSCLLFCWGRTSAPLCCSCIQLVGHSLQCCRYYSLASCNVYCQIICKEWSIHYISQFSYLFRETYLPTHTLIYLSLISCSSVFPLLTLSFAFSISKKIAVVFSFLLNPSIIFLLGGDFPFIFYDNGEVITPPGFAFFASFIFWSYC